MNILLLNDSFQRNRNSIIKTFTERIPEYLSKRIHPIYLHTVNYCFPKGSKQSKCYKIFVLN